ncbi:MAG: adenosylcobinamide-GDP ribazoletransferase [Okeania sp. SIO2D1]|nr:adenosylcobinamide-GDP ribazoletransferase [Okeania sp. SIO2D1]
MRVWLNFQEWAINHWRSYLGAVVFYTCLPIPLSWGAQFHRVSRWAPLIGILIGGFLGLVDLGLSSLGIPFLTRSALLVALWAGITGGLHLDGAIDTGDGLAVLDKQRRLEVMQDSTIGAFGAMVVVFILLLKTTALSDIGNYRWLVLMLVAGWGRWGQVVAIAFYPYLKAEGKGAFHKQNFCLPYDLLLGLLTLLSLNALEWYLYPESWWVALSFTMTGCATAVLAATWFKWQLGGHTGDTYGAVVEWTETILLCIFTAFDKVI